MLLAIDPSTRRIGIAIFDGSQILTEMTWASPFHHTMELAPAVESSLRYAGLQASGLTAVGAAIGPGSFTALRTGLAFVKGLVLAHGIPVIGIPSLDITAASQPKKDVPLIAVLEAGRKRLAARRYSWKDGWQAEEDGQLVTLEKLDRLIDEPTWLCGELDAKAREILSANPLAQLASPAQSLRRPAVLAELAWKRFSNADFDHPSTIAPLYLSTEGIEK